MTIKDPKTYFNATYQSWQKELTDEKRKIISQTLTLLKVRTTDAVLDVGCGTGVLYDAMIERGISQYLGLDISENMLSAFRTVFPDAKTLCGNFDDNIHLNQSFDLCIIFNSIPHFENLEMVFKNAYNHLKPEGMFAIVHARTRQGLKEHHQKINYSISHDPIPSDDTLVQLCEANHFRLDTILDQDFFFFLCEKK
ncbi:class I SAM-dependent DNA methyltransferase [Fusibacter ferrireducens]|uniref:Class I SAM-dependent methyltransferase n=1 Tax=Fusibacter ferrireducens TaxID=2785058 RepID=A0ABR9ZT18_9FIRM|nr:class I SAM-dependent methyltransferase [Fusibacter ferrireducens]MBF4693501.1 class I SAM-dependent methyltransferase [Fusibacter ferrireducens]